MEKLFSNDESEFYQAFSTLQSAETFSDYINEIIGLIQANELSRPQIDQVLNKYQIRSTIDIKDELLGLVLLYVNIVLNDNVITETEARNVDLLKKAFKIQEGDFYKFKRFEIQQILNRQIERIYSDNEIDEEEALLKVGLQELFDLGYDEFLEFVSNEVKNALLRGGDLMDLDTVLKQSELAKLRTQINASYDRK